MTENIFFNFNRLKKKGKNAIIGKTVRIRHPELCSIGNYSIIDDFTYISTMLKIGNYTHISSNVTIAGGKEHKCELKSFMSLSSGVRVYCSTDDYVNGIVSTCIPKKIQKSIAGDILMKDFSAVGANSVILPNVVLGKGTVIGACSLVLPNQVLKEWTVYAGIPAKPLKKRNKKSIIDSFQKIKKIES